MKDHSSLQVSLFFTLSLALIGGGACGDDAGHESEDDAGQHDGGAHDGGHHDSGAEDGGGEDAGAEDAGGEDAGADAGGEDASEEDGGNQGSVEPDAGEEAKSVTLQFMPVVGGSAFACDQTFMLGTPATEVEVLDLRMYVHDVKLLDARTGDEVALELAQDTPFQSGAIALLDFEDGTGSCEGNAETNRVVTGTVPAGEYTGVTFTLGVPFDDNHQDVNLADAPLNVPALFWNWLGGYKFAKVDVAAAGEAGGSGMERWNFHLGETGCPASSTTDAGMPIATDPPSGECAKPNRATYVFEEFDIDADTLEIDLAALFDGSDLTGNAGGPPGCMSVPLDSADCAAIFPSLGLDYDTGACDSDCATQTVFSVQ